MHAFISCFSGVGHDKGMIMPIDHAQQHAGIGGHGHADFPMTNEQCALLLLLRKPCRYDKNMCASCHKADPPFHLLTVSPTVRQCNDRKHNNHGAPVMKLERCEQLVPRKHARKTAATRMDQHVQVLSFPWKPWAYRNAR